MKTAKARESGDHIELGLLKKEIQNENTASKSWMIQKINSVIDGVVE